MVFKRKYPRSGETIHIRVPKVYAEHIQELMKIFDEKFEPDQGKNLLRKYMNNFM